jgi:hypothetical protein
VQIDDCFVYQQHVIVNIAKMRPDCRASARKVVPSQLVADLDHRRDGVAHVKQSGAQAINPFDLVTRRHCREYIVLDRFEFFGDLVDDWEVIIADKVENSAHDCALAQAQQLWIALATLSHFGVGGRRAMPD